MPPPPSFSARLWAFCVLLFPILIYIAVGMGALAQSPSGAPAPLLADSLGKAAIPVNGPWQFHLGDDLAWAQPGINDATGQDGWEQITADAPWGAQKYPNHTGYAWYRRHIRVSVAPGAPDDLSLMIRRVDDVYDVYWNGARVGGLGSFPPRLSFYLGLPPQIYKLGSARDGVLAVRVLKLPFSSVDDGTGGGFAVAPMLGTSPALAVYRESLDYHWLARRQPRFGLTSLYLLTSFLSFAAWLRDRKQKLLFWLALYTFMPLLELLAEFGFSISGDWLTLWVQGAIQLREMCQWFLLVYLLQLADLPRLMRFLRIGAWVTITAGVIDGGLGFVLGSISEATFVVSDAILTAIVLPAEIVPAVLVIIALARRKPLDHARWLVAGLATTLASWYGLSNVALQGVRYTHWPLGDWMNHSVFSLFGSPQPVLAILRTLLFFSIVYAVLAYATDYRRRQAALEQEYQNARELQQILVPESLPEIPGFRLSSAYRPAQEVGGDFFQIVPLDGTHLNGENQGSTMIVLGDVSGKGLKAAMTVSMIVGAIRTLCEMSASPADLLAGLNRRLSGRLNGGFATCIAIRLEPEGRCVVATAGHPSPVLNRTEIPLPGALPLGILPATTYEEVPCDLQSGDHLALYTDGLLEARNAAGELYGFDRLTILFGNHTSADQATAEAIAFGQDDDITVLTLTCVRDRDRSAGTLAALMA